jgi:hypothetical protein
LLFKSSHTYVWHKFQREVTVMMLIVFYVIYVCIYVCTYIAFHFDLKRYIHIAAIVVVMVSSIPAKLSDLCISKLVFTYICRYSRTYRMHIPTNPIFLHTYINIFERKEKNWQQFPQRNALSIYFRKTFLNTFLGQYLYIFFSTHKQCILSRKNTTTLLCFS